MLEVCFSDSTKGGLSVAQRCGGRNFASAIGIITDKRGISDFFKSLKIIKKIKKENKRLQKAALPLGGTKEDIVGVCFNFSEGDISSEITAENCQRKEYIRSWIAFDRYNDNFDVEEAIETFWQSCINDLDKLKSNPEKIRIWLDKTPEAQAGLLFVADLLKDSQTEISVVELPEKVKASNNSIIEYRGWGEVKPELFGTFLYNERKLYKQKISDLALKWQVLKEENSSLRVVENNMVVSVDISYYDDLIRECFPEESCRVALIIGRALGLRKILTGDVFIAKRIEEFIKNGELKVIRDENKGFYSLIVESVK